MEYNFAVLLPGGHWLLKSGMVYCENHAEAGSSGLLSRDTLSGYVTASKRRSLSASRLRKTYEYRVTHRHD
jgi:hypothetical protein